MVEIIYKAYYTCLFVGSITAFNSSYAYAEISAFFFDHRDDQRRKLYSEQEENWGCKSSISYNNKIGFMTVESGLEDTIHEYSDFGCMRLRVRKDMSVVLPEWIDLISCIKTH